MNSHYASNKPFRSSNSLLQPLSRKIGLLPILILFLFITTPLKAAEDINWDKLVLSIIKVESNGNPNALGSNNDVGLMQITPIVLKEYNNIESKIKRLVAEFNDVTYSDPNNYYNIGDLYNPSINVEIGTWYLKRLYHYYKCSTVKQIAMSYNGGITRARRNGFDLKKMPRSIQNYVKKVTRLYYQGGSK